MAKNCQWFHSFIISKRVPLYASRVCGDLVVWSLVDNREVMSSNSAVGDRALGSHGGPHRGFGQFPCSSSG